MSELTVFFAGTAGSTPTAARGLPAVMLTRGGEKILFDCGEGTQRQLLSTVGLAELDSIYITHYHTDHWLGLPGMLNTFQLRGREAPLKIYGPAGLQAVKKLLLEQICSPLHYPIEFIELEPNQGVAADGYSIVPFEVDHRCSAYGYALVEEQRPGRFSVEAATRHGITDPRDFGRLQRGESVNGVLPEHVMDSPRLGRKVVITGDTRPCDAVKLAAYQADLLIHEATFIDQESERAALTHHSTASQAATIASQAEVKLLALVHLSSRYMVREIRKPAQEIFENTVVPRDFDVITVPYPERGTAKLKGWAEYKNELQQQSKEP